MRFRIASSPNKNGTTHHQTIMKFHLFSFLAVLSAASSFTFGKTYTVGPSRMYTNLQQVTTLLVSGDIVLVDGNVNYDGGIFLSIPGTAANPITIKGVTVNGNRPILTGGVYGINISNAHFNIIDGFVITATTKAGIGHFADQIIIRNCVYRDNLKDCIIGYGQFSGSLTLEYSELYHNGESTLSPNAHQIYMATDEVAFPNASFRMQHCYIHDGNGGNNVKSRSGRNEIYYNWIEGATYHGLELIGPDAEDSDLGNEATKREDSDVVGNVNFITLGGAGARIGGDGTSQTWRRYRFVNNTLFLNDRGDAIRGYTGAQTLEMFNNIIFNKTAASETRVFDDNDINWANERQVIGSNNWLQTGTSFVPPEFTSTISGPDPGFININSNNAHLISSSASIDQGIGSSATIVFYPSLDPLFPPEFQPPLHTVQSSPSSRPNDGALDIGAYEFDATVITENN